MSSEAVGWVFRHSPYEGATFAVHLAIADSVNDQADFEFWMRQRACAVKARVGRQTVNTAIARMVSDGLLELVLEGRGGANRYRFLMPADTPAKFANAAHRVSSQTTPPVTVGVVTDDKGVVVGDRGVSSTTTRVSSEAIGGVVTDDTEPKRTQDQPKSSSSPTVVARHTDVPAGDDDEDLRIAEALRLVAERAVADQPGVRDPKAYLAKAVRNAHAELGDRVEALARQHPDWPASRIAAETVKLGAPDPLERTAAAALAIATKDRSCPDCRGAGVREIEPGVAIQCTHGEAA